MYTAFQTACIFALHDTGIFSSPYKTDFMPLFRDSGVQSAR
ncbi:hypothetical protein l11_02990 [Neisseria weaveri LMG 5135]|nr:hypothetical protein l11_02990 [Neisseria weaveri LMG 5135]